MGKTPENAAPMSAQSLTKHQCSLWECACLRRRSVSQHQRKRWPHSELAGFLLFTAGIMSAWLIVACYEWLYSAKSS
ncbi:MAG: hypothetical protein RR845_23700, partial [Pseudomonas sp.]